jgi:biotin carboxyl carrier protein
MDNSFYNSSISFANALNSFQDTPATTAAASIQTSQTNPLGEFKDLMALMILSTLSTSSSSSGSSDSSSDMGMGNGTGMNMGSLMAPLMFSLLEKLLAGQVQTEEPKPVVDVVEPKKEVREAAPSPSGTPVKASLTQGSHVGHIALDFGVPVGTNVKSTMDGKVTYAGWNNEGYGNLVIVENGKYRTYFGHLSNIPVKVGEKVSAGTVIGLSGNTGNSTGPHLHYEVRVNGSPINPTGFTMK